MNLKTRNGYLLAVLAAFAIPLSFSFAKFDFKEVKIDWNAIERMFSRHNVVKLGDCELLYDKDTKQFVKESCKGASPKELPKKEAAKKDDGNVWGEWAPSKKAKPKWDWKD